MSTRHHFRGMRRGARGLSLVELMISMVLGLLVVGGAIGAFMSNRQTYRATESLGRMQENARVAFELMARDIREAGGSPCGKNLPVANVLNNAGDAWWSTWGDGLTGYDDGELADSAAGTDAISVMSATSGGSVGVVPSGTAANFKLAVDSDDFEQFDVAMVCDNSQASLFQITDINSGTVVVHNEGNVEQGPGNCDKLFGLPLSEKCGGKAKKGTEYTYGEKKNMPAVVAQLKAATWFLADNGRDGGRSLYRIRMDKGVLQDREEIVEGIRDMQIEYLLDGGLDYVVAGAVPSWGQVQAVRIELTLEGTERVSTEGDELTRELAHIVTLRSRVP